MMRPLLIICALLVILTGALHLFPGGTPRAAGSRARPERATLATEPEEHLHRGAVPLVPHDFRTDFLDLLAPFETNDDTDPFMREKRATAFQSRIDLLDPSEIASAYQAAA